MQSSSWANPIKLKKIPYHACEANKQYRNDFIFTQNTKIWSASFANPVDQLVCDSDNTKYKILIRKTFKNLLHLRTKYAEINMDFHYELISVYFINKIEMILNFNS